MLQINTGTRYWLYHHFADARLSFDGLCGIVTNQLQMEMQLQDVFIFLNKRQTHIKLLQFEGDGFAIYYKRLEQGSFELPANSNEGLHSGLTAKQLMLILQGVSLKKAVFRKRYTPK